MFITTSKKLANLLQQQARKTEKFKNYNIYQTKFNEIQFEHYVDFNAYNHNIDYDYKTGLFNVITIEYPGDFYACNTYLTTKDLTKAYNTIKDGITLEKFLLAVLNMVEI